MPSGVPGVYPGYTRGVPGDVLGMGIPGVYPKISKLVPSYILFLVLNYCTDRHYRFFDALQIQIK